MSDRTIIEQDEYLAVLAQAHQLRAVATGLSANGALQRAIAAAERADSIGPIVDPTLWQTREKQLREDVAAMRAVLALAQTGKEAGS